MRLTRRYSLRGVDARRRAITTAIAISTRATTTDWNDGVMSPVIIETTAPMRK